MSQYAIREYRNEVEKIIHYGGTKKETAIRNAFYVLLNKYADTRELKLIPEISLRTKTGRIVTPDGTLKAALPHTSSQQDERLHLCIHTQAFS
jgi:hypothetical protein